jgi:hypothetical protein
MPPNYLPVTNTHQGTPFRQPLGNREQHADQHSFSSQAGGVYGMSGIKVGRQPSGYMSRAGMNSGRPVVGMGFR